MQDSNNIVKPYVKFGAIPTEDGAEPLYWVIADYRDDSSDEMHLICASAVDQDEEDQGMDYRQWVKEVFLDAVFDKEDLKHISHVEFADKAYIKSFFGDVEDAGDFSNHPTLCVDKSGVLSKENWFYILETKDGGYDQVFVTEIEEAAKETFMNEDDGEIK